MIGIVDYGAGNIKSVKNSLDFAGAKFKEVKFAEDIKGCDKLILPGVGAFSDAMRNLKSLSLDEAIREFVKSGRDFLGICLGMQLLFDSSDEFGYSQGLGILKGKVVKFNTELKVPHMGWNTIKFMRETPLNRRLDEFAYFYFVHSYHVICDEKITLGVSEYGYEFTSCVNADNIYGIQPHPEKSHKFGIKVIKNFVEA